MRNSYRFGSISKYEKLKFAERELARITIARTKAIDVAAGGLGPMCLL